MKDSGIPWIGEIPADWEVFKIKNLMSGKSKRGYPDEQVLSLYRDYGVIPKDHRDDNHNITSDDTGSYKLVDVGDFVINKMKAWQGSMAVSNYRGIISPAYYVCSFKNVSLYKGYIHYLLRNEAYKPEYRRLSTGMRVGQWDLNLDDFMSIPCILPSSIIEQQKIAAFLDRKCGEVDELIALEEKMIEELKAYKQSVITETITKGLNPDVPMKDSGVEWIGQIPEHWEVDKLVRLFNVIGSGTTPKTTDEAIGDDEVNWIQSGDINGAFITSSKNKVSQNTIDSYSALKIYKQPFIIVAMYGASVGNAGISLIDACVNQACCVMGAPNLEMDYAFNAIKAAKDYLLQKAVGGGQPNISQDTLKQLWLPKPSLGEQKQIAEYLEKKCGHVDSLISIKQSKIAELQDYKRSIIYEYATGKKEVPTL